VITVLIGQMAELLRQFEAVTQVLWRDEVFRGLNTTMQIANLEYKNTFNTLI